MYCLSIMHALFQFRPPVAMFVLELPAGLIDHHETPPQAALRELREETGYTGKPIFTLFQYFYSISNLITIYDY
jgi:8-oxo-dGTP pyrophosphatase MutT (NUDIX family)